MVALGVVPDVALIDGNRAPSLACRTVTLVGGDAISLSIAAASVVAKVTRDRMMAALAGRYPLYGWDGNAGYPTPAHCAAIVVHGISPHHRRSFAPVRAALRAQGYRLGVLRAVQSFSLLTRKVGPCTSRSHGQPADP